MGEAGLAVPGWGQTSRAEQQNLCPAYFFFFSSSSTFSGRTGSFLMRTPQALLMALIMAPVAGHGKHTINPVLAFNILMFDR
jgi:hypothetical protein